MKLIILSIFIYINIIFGQELSANYYTTPNGGNVKVSINGYGIPFITAMNEHDLGYAQGKWACENRLYQMDYTRRRISGHLSEIMGPDFIDADMLMRTFGFSQVAEKNANNTDTLVGELMDYYLSGVNDCIKNLPQLPQEFRELGYSPDPFTRKDIFLSIKLLSFGMGAPMFAKEMERGFQLDFVDRKRLDFLWQYYKDTPVVLPNYKNLNEPYNQEPELDAESAFEQYLKKLPQDLKSKMIRRKAGQKLGKTLKKYGIHHPFTSNNWVLNGSLTQSGKPLLCDDPHLPYSQPMIWYLIGLEAPGYKAIGSALPIIPGVVIGRNDKVAWGFTNMAATTGDFYAIDVSFDGTQYQHDGEWKDFTVRKETIKVKGGKSEKMEIYHTVYGPVTVGNPDDPEAIVTGTYALRWMALDDVDSSGGAVIGFGRSTDLNSFMKGLKKVHSLTMNTVVADVAGDIAYTGMGAVPMRVPGDNAFLPKVGNGTYDWKGYIPFEELPSVVNPASGFVASANNMIVKQENYKYVMTPAVNYAPGFRATQIEKMIKQQRHHTVDTMADIQGSYHNTLWDAFKPAFGLIQDNKLPGYARDWYKQLKQWDGVQTLDSLVAGIYNKWSDCLQNVNNILGEEGALPFIITIFSPRKGADDIACTTNGHNGCNAYSTQCFLDGVNNLTNSGSSNPPQYRMVHKAKFIHVPDTGNYSIIESVGGGSETPFAQDTSIFFEDGKYVFAGVSYRQIVDFGDLEGNSKFVLPTGQSGDPNSRHYKDMLKLWSNVEYLPMKSQF